MEREIKLKYLLKEARRCIIAILIAGLVGGIALSYMTVSSIKNSRAYVQYASVCYIQIDNPKDGVVEWAMPDYTELNKAMLLSDEVMDGIANDPEVQSSGINTEAIREAFFLQGDTYGELIKVISLTYSQEESNLICRKIEEYGIKYLNERGVAASVLQTTEDYGPASVTIPPDTVNVVKLNPSAVPAYSVTSIAKRFALGFVGMAAVAYFVICLLYILRDKVVYASELEDEDIPVLGVYNNKSINISKEILSNILLKYRDAKSVVLVQLSGGTDTDKLTSDWHDNGVVPCVLGDMAKDPMIKTKLHDCDAVAVIIKANTLTMEEVKREIARIRNSNIPFAGAVFSEGK